MVVFKKFCAFLLAFVLVFGSIFLFAYFSKPDCTVTEAFMVVVWVIVGVSGAGTVGFIASALLTYAFRKD